jgi:hypothetical protein
MTFGKRMIMFICEIKQEQNFMPAIRRAKIKQKE